MEFRRYELFTPDPNALVLEEGVTPAGQSLAQSKIGRGQAVRRVCRGQ
ncbi:MAG: hypothetical protein R2912_04890 [Eubacteriales bacterium]